MGSNARFRRATVARNMGWRLLFSNVNPRNSFLTLETYCANENGLTGEFVPTQEILVCGCLNLDFDGHSCVSLCARLLCFCFVFVRLLRRGWTGMTATVFSPS